MFHQGSKHRETDESTGSQGAGFVSRCLEPLMKYEARVFAIASYELSTIIIYYARFVLLI